MKGKSNNHVIAFKESKLRDQETVQGHLEGWIGEMMGTKKNKQHNGQLIVTTKRVCFYRKGIFGEVFETIPHEKISSVETLSMMGYRVLRFHTSNDELEFKTFEGRDLFDEVYEKLEELRHTNPNSQVNSADSVADQLLKLAQMKGQGVISDGEFAELKRKMIAAQ